MRASCVRTRVQTWAESPQRASEPGTIHPYARHQTTARIDHGDVVWDTHFDRLARSRCDDTSRIREVQRRDWSRHVLRSYIGSCIDEITGISAIRLDDGVG